MPPSTRRLTGSLLGVPEPAPAQFLVRRPSYPWLVVGTTCVAAFIGQVDASIVQLALPTLEGAFHSGLATVSWVAVGYVLASASILPVFARIAEIAGRKLMYLFGFALFGIASMLCGLAPDLPLLILFRVLQGISGAMLGANSIVILVAAAGPERRGRAMGVFAAAQAVGISAGPALGGLILSMLSWRWLFWVNVPFALCAVAIGWLVVPLTQQTENDRRFDLPGALLLIPALITLLTAIMQSQAWGLISVGTITCIVAAVVLFIAFIVRENRKPAPLLDLNLFRAAAFSGGCVAVALSYAMLYGMFFAMAYALVRGYHDPPLAAGLRLTIIPLALGIVAPFSGAWYERRPRLVMVGGMAICIAAAGALTTVMTGTPSSLLRVMAALAVFGGGLGMFIAPNNSATISAAPANKSGEAGGLLNLMRALGTGTGVAAASSVLAWGVGEHTAGVAEPVLLGAIRDVLLMLAGFAIIAGAASLLRSDPRRPAEAFAALNQQREPAPS